MSDETTNMIVRGVPPRLKGKIAKRVAKEGTNLNDVVVGLLAAHFDVPFSPSGYKTPREITEYPNLVVEVPVALKRRIDWEAAESGDSIRNVVVRILADEFGVAFKPTGRWVNRRKTATA